MRRPTLSRSERHKLCRREGPRVPLKSPDVKMEIVLPARAGKREEVKTRSRRTSPEGNGGKTAAARTLRRDTASNGLVAVRRAVRQSMSVRFTALLHHMAFGTRG